MVARETATINSRLNKQISETNLVGSEWAIPIGSHRKMVALWNKPRKNNSTGAGKRPGSVVVWWECVNWALVVVRGVAKIPVHGVAHLYDNKH